MKCLSNQCNGDLPKGEVEGSKDMALYPLSTPSYQKKHLPPLPSLDQCPPPFAQSRRSIDTTTSIASFEPLPKAELSSLSLPSIGDTEDDTTTSTTCSRSPADVAMVASTDLAATPDIASPRANQDSDQKEWPPPLEQHRRSIGTTKSITSFKSLSGRSYLPFPTIGEKADCIPTSTTNPSVTPSSISVEVSTDSDTTVAFDIAPPRVDRDLAERGSREAGNGNISTTDESNDVLREVASISSLPSPITATVEDTPIRPPSIHLVKPDHDDEDFIDQPLRLSSLPPCWSEGAGEDLATHLGPSERRRQEIMWEIVTSEERYVAELLRMRETFISPLLRPYPDSSSSTMIDYDDTNTSHLETLVESSEHSPFASRPSGAGFEDSEDDSRKAGTTPCKSRQGGKGIWDLTLECDPREPLDSRTLRDSFVSLSLSLRSLRLPLRRNSNAVSTASLGRGSSVGLSPIERETFTKADFIANGCVAPHQLPDDLRLCLEAIENILEDHLKLIEALRKRYNGQYPLVRSLADVFLDNLHMFRSYGSYVLHLERALDQTNDVLSTRTSARHPKTQWPRIYGVLHNLETNAKDRGETGLAISLSKPFQRLLIYPQLFQSVLFHTDPWMFEYEDALQLAAEVEAIVRGIENEKLQEEERNKTRDILARISGLDKAVQFTTSKPSRVLVEERMLNPSDTGMTRDVGGKRSFKLSRDLLRNGGIGIGSRKDLWLVVFNDVTLRCQRIGITPHWLGAAHSSRLSSLSELGENSEYATVTADNRTSTAQPRNLYKFIKIENWFIGNVNQPCEGVVSMEDVARSRAQIYSPVWPRFTPEGDEDRSAHRSTDNVNLRKTLAESQLSRGGYGAGRTGSRLSLLSSRSSLANAKSGSRHVSAKSSFSGSRTPSCLNVPTSSRHSVVSEEGYSVKAFNRLSLREHGWRQSGPTAPFLYSEEPTTSRSCSLGRQTIASR